jgi:hypothetical protein
MKDKRFSIICDLDYCIICGSPHIQKHEVFYGTANRKKSIEYGLVIPLCYAHHNKDKQSGSIHFNPDFDLEQKQKAQKIAMEKYGWTIEDFRKVFGKNYL